MEQGVMYKDLFITHTETIHMEKNWPEVDISQALCALPKTNLDVHINTKHQTSKVSSTELS